MPRAESRSSRPPISASAGSWSEIALRLWPAATALQDVITALFNLVAEHELAFSDIARVRLALGKTPFAMHGKYSTWQAKFEALLSAHYVAAVFLRDRQVTLAQFEPARYDDPALRRFAAEKVDASTEDASLGGGQAVATVETTDGRTLAARCDSPLGAPDNPLTLAQIEDKFRTYATDVISEGRIEKAIDMVAHLEELADARSLIELVGGAS